MYSIFDSNSYRYWVRDKNYSEYSADIALMRQSESVIQIKPVQNIVVLVELMKHLVNPLDPNFNECINAITAAVLHCQTIGNDKKSVTFVPGIDYAIYLEIHQKLPANSDYENSVLTLAIEIAEKVKHGDTINSLLGPLKINLNNELQNRTNFYNSIVASLKMIDPKCTGFEDFLKDKVDRTNFLRILRRKDFYKVAAFSKISRIATPVLPVTLSEAEFDRIAQKFAPAVDFERKFWEKLANGIAIQDGSHKEINTLYDIMILIGGLISYPDSIFVTREKQIIDSFKKGGMSHKVMDLPSYLAHLKLSSIQLKRYNI